MKGVLGHSHGRRRWLRSLGLEQYEAAFRDNAIDEKVLPTLTTEDLKDLGVSIVGHRRTLLNAITALRSEDDPKATTSLAIPAAKAAPKETAERRQVTVMFSDLVASTALSARMDPEDLREVISGDGVLVYYGYPQAHEDDSERAVRAGLETSLQRARESYLAIFLSLRTSVPRT